MGGFNNFDLVSMMDSERTRQSQRFEQTKNRALQSTSMALNTVGSILGLFFPPVGAALSAASQGVQLGGAASKSVDVASRSSLGSFGRLNGVPLNLNSK